MFGCAGDLVELLEANVLRTLPEALTADVETVLADQTVAVTAHTALAGTRTISAGVRVPDVLVSHDCS